jgi:hypothetical protein
MIPAKNPEACLVGAYGVLRTDRTVYRPLDTVTVTIEGRACGDTTCRIRVHDADQVPYFESDVALQDNVGQVEFLVAGALGAHYIYLDWPAQPHYSRYLNFEVDAATAIESGDRDFDELYPFSRAMMKLGRREYQTPRGRMVGYISADTWHFDGIWLRDWIYGLPGYQHWETVMSDGLDRFLECQTADGMVPDGIERSGKTWRVGLESDVEYIITLGVFQTWCATGDDRWLATMLPKLELALDYIRRDEKHWDAGHQLIKRQHSCDTWDFDIDHAGDSGSSRHVIATCDQSGYCLAFQAMGAMYRHLGQEPAAAAWFDYAERYRQRAAALLWDGGKFLHHVHLDPIDHGDFDESQQLAMGNTWAMTRGLATPEQARSIIDEYQRRQLVTQDAYPWWSLQPGYPDHLGYFASRTFCRQGGYANGGLMPWVGGELCLAAFSFGRESYGVELLRQYAEHLRRTGGAQVWYWPDGEPGFRTTNEVPYAGWGMANWVGALIEGLAGIRPGLAAQLRRVQVSPCWLAAGVHAASATVRFAASKAYFAYQFTCDPAHRSLSLLYCGSGQSAELRLLLPADFRTAQVECNGAAIAWREEAVEASRYLCCELPIAGVGLLLVS